MIDLTALTDAIRQATITLREGYNDEQAYTSLLNEAKALVRVLEKPPDICTKVAINLPSQFLCIRLAIDLGLFDSLAQKSPQQVSELASASEAEEQFILRVMRTNAASGIVAECGAGTFQSTTVSHHLTKASVKAGIIHWFDQGLPSIASAPEYFKQNQYRSPPSCTKGPLQYANKTDLETYQFWQTRPAVAENFNTFMTGHFGGKRIHWSGWFPQKEEIVDKFDPKQSHLVFVDVGGGPGREVNSIRTKFPKVEGRFILEDLPEVIGDVRSSKTLDDRVELVEYNFFTPQPLKGAFVYFLANILHNWPDEESLTILKNLAVAMTPGYSRLFICDMVLPDTNCSEDGTGFDVGMMVLHSGMQRSEGQWVQLLQQAGLKLVKVWRPSSADYSAVVEATRE